MSLLRVSQMKSTPTNPQAGDRIDRRFELRQGVRARCGQRAPHDTRTGPRGSPSAGCPRRSASSGPRGRRGNWRSSAFPARTAEARRPASPRASSAGSGRRPGKTYPPSRPVDRLEDSRIGRVAGKPAPGTIVLVGGVSIDRTLADARPGEPCRPPARPHRPSNPVTAPRPAQVAGQARQDSTRLGAISTVKSAVAGASSRTRSAYRPALRSARSSRGPGRRADARRRSR